jgi:hypothetical protein
MKHTARISKALKERGWCGSAHSLPDGSLSLDAAIYETARDMDEAYATFVAVYEAIGRRDDGRWYDARSGVWRKYGVVNWNDLPTTDLSKVMEVLEDV